MGDITSANVVFTLVVPGLFPIPIPIQGFAADDIFDFEDVDAAETLMGVDGVLSGGVVFMPKPQNITLQADSVSNAVFDQWNQAQQIAVQLLPGIGQVTFTAIGTTWALSTGILRRYNPIPPAKRVLQPRRYRIEWGKVIPAAVTGGG
jgi:hypothetical protein